MKLIKKKSNLTLKLSPSDSKLNLTPLRCTAHHPNHNMMGSTKHGLSVHSNDFVPGEESTVHICSAARYYMTDGDLYNILN